MPWNGSGTYALPAASFPEVNGTTIDATRFNTTMNDVSTGLNNALAKDGQNAATANLPMGGFKHTGAAAATVAGQYLTFAQTGAQLSALGVAVTPNAGWGSDWSPIDFRGQNAIGSVAGTSFYFMHNSYNDNTVFRAKSNAASALLALFQEGFYVYNAPTVAANAAQAFVERLRVDNNGLTFSNTTVCASDGGTQTRSSATWVLMNGFTAEALDVGNNFNALSTFTAPVAGVYEIRYTGTVVGAGAGVTGQARVYKNGVAVGALQFGEATSTGTADYATIATGGFISLAAADTIEIYSRRSNGAVDCYFTNGVLSVRRVQ